MLVYILIYIDLKNPETVQHKYSICILCSPYEKERIDLSLGKLTQVQWSEGDMVTVLSSHPNVLVEPGAVQEEKAQMKDY